MHLLHSSTSLTLKKLCFRDTKPIILLHNYNAFSAQNKLFYRIKPMEMHHFVFYFQRAYTKAFHNTLIVNILQGSVILA